MTIWKFPLANVDVQTVSMPRGARVLCVQTQYGEPCVWALVDPLEPKVDCTFRIYGTGHEHAVFSGEYIGTYQLGAGQLVFHLFEEESR